MVLSCLAALVPNLAKPTRCAIMNLYSGNETRLRSLKLDEDWLVLDPETESFFKAETRVEDGEELRKHIIGVQEEAYKASPSVFFRSRLST